MAEMDDRPQPVRRVGGRSAKVRAAVVAAVLAELAESGYHGMTVDGVARRAGVNKTTLYRRWGSRSALVAEAVQDRVAERVPIPDTGSLREDLLELTRTAIGNALSPEVNAVIRAAAGGWSNDEFLRGGTRQFWAERLELDGEVVRRAVERGEIAETDPAAVIEAVLGPPYFRMLVSAREIDDQFIVDTVDTVVRGLRKP